MYSWNCRGLINLATQANLCHQITLEKPHNIIALQETFLKPENKIYFPDYVVHRSERLGGHGGGVALLIRRDIRHKRIKAPKVSPMEIVTVNLYITGNPLHVSSVYVQYQNTHIILSAI